MEALSFRITIGNALSLLLAALLLTGCKPSTGAPTTVEAVITTSSVESCALETLEADLEDVWECDNLQPTQPEMEEILPETAQPQYSEQGIELPDHNWE